MESRLQHSLRKRRLENFRDYYHILRYDTKREEEIACFIDLLTVHEAYFFREEGQLKSFAQEALPELVERRRPERSLRIWSAGCSRGEEPYTIAMLLSEQAELAGWNIEIIASDVSDPVLAAARRGFYQGASLRSVPPEYLVKYFVPDENGYRIAEGPRRLVTFLRLNLVEREKWAFLLPIDAIFCRNVLIYFSLEARKTIVEGFFRKLSRGGFLFLGHSESLLNISALYAVRYFKHDVAYQKASGARVETLAGPRP